MNETCLRRPTQREADASPREARKDSTQGSRRLREPLARRHPFS